MFVACVFVEGRQVTNGPAGDHPEAGPKQGPDTKHASKARRGPQAHKQRTALRNPSKPARPFQVEPTRCAYAPSQRPCMRALLIRIHDDHVMEDLYIKQCSEPICKDTPRDPSRPKLIGQLRVNERALERRGITEGRHSMPASGAHLILKMGQRHP